MDNSFFVNVIVLFIITISLAWKNINVVEIILVDLEVIFIINKKDENAVVPIWSNAGDKIAYLSFKTVVQNSPESDLYPCNLMLYDVGKRSSQILSGDASFTDKAFPQMCFDEKDEYIYFTKINEAGLGSIARINLKTLQQETISKDSNLDERFPSVKNF